MATEVKFFDSNPVQYIAWILHPLSNSWSTYTRLLIFRTSITDCYWVGGNTRYIAPKISSRKHLKLWGPRGQEPSSLDFQKQGADKPEKTNNYEN